MRGSSCRRPMPRASSTTCLPKRWRASISRLGPSSATRWDHCRCNGNFAAVSCRLAGERRRRGDAPGTEGEAAIRRLVPPKLRPLWSERLKRRVVEHHRHVEGLVAALDQKGNGPGHVLEWKQRLGAFQGRSIYCHELVARLDAGAD